MGAMAATTTGAFPAITASAATLDIPGIGNFDVPDQFAPQVQQFNQAAKDAATALQAAPAPAAPAPAPQFQLPSLFNKSSSVGDIALHAAETKVGAQYSWGATGPYSFDCSGLVQWAYKQAGVELPRTSFEQSNVGAPVAFEDLQPGDIVVTNGGGHVGIYAGDGKLLNAVQSGTPVSYTNLHPSQVVTARRIAT
ncbi:C40 family peptidase [Nocardia seriolae]|nr:NlpC/P60 family protein [Nocardia seriolae]MTJ66928.1 NlpC/P60 family protein [Nocardia seriolae]MTJ74269.1 NlpC/P60 family protein [Nocardia seriolae]MTJ84910.1 NlpC/P60 family protein [Nocardia seriolae]MTK28906.1 NlpC/P60 family protein [Nocardia seriolae]MTK44906.1 NlpC/P60 family protein [Nocardia seriolae]